jgi:two-component system sensor histidine kinase AlgZ
MLRTYLDIEQARWRERLAVEFAPDPALAAHRLPAFLLLPFVENAVKHGGATSPDLLRIRVSSHRAATGDLVIEIANTGRWLAGQGTATVPSHGLGLENIRARLSKIFPGRHQLIVSVRDDWVTVTLQLPAP